MTGTKNEAGMEIPLWVLQWLLALLFLFAGGAEVCDAD